jgi:hypothetical protein
MNLGAGAVSMNCPGENTPAEPPRAWPAKWLQQGGTKTAALNETQWAAFCEEHSRNVYLMPQIACLRHETDSPPLVYATRKPDGTIRSLGVLSSREVPVPTLPKMAVTLDGRRFVGGMLVGDESIEAARDLIDTAVDVRRSGDSDFLMVQDAESPSPIRQAMLEAPRRHPVICSTPIEPRVHRWIQFPAKAEDYWTKFSKKSRYNFRWRAKHLDHRIECVEKARDVAEFTRRVSEFTENTWQYKRLGFKIDTQLKGQMWSEIARLGGFRSYLMWQGDRILAYAVGIQWKGLFRYEETGYDPAFAAKSPGQVLLYRLIEDLIARDTPELLDFGSGDSEYKRIYGNHETFSGPVLLARKSPRTVAAFTANRLRNLAGAYSRWMLERFGALSHLRHLRRGHPVARADDESA